MGDEEVGEAVARIDHVATVSLVDSARTASGASAAEREVDWKDLVQAMQLEIRALSVAILLVAGVLAGVLVAQAHCTATAAAASIAQAVPLQRRLEVPPGSRTG